MKLKATKEQLADMILEGATKQKIAVNFGYASTHSVNWALRKYFGTSVLKNVKQKIITPKFWDTKFIEDSKAFAKQFDNPIAQQDFRTRKGFNRIEEIWAKEGLS